MCGRLAQYRPAAELAAQFNAKLVGEPPPPRYNLAPRHWVLAVRLDPQGERELVRLYWGLIPPWAKGRSFGDRTFNARAETVAVKPSFRAAFRQRRCLIPVDGFYEWQKTPTGKQPYFIARRDGQPLALAGLWERWADPDSGEALESMTIIVTEAHERLCPIHDRMPVILDLRDHDLWLAQHSLSAEASRWLCASSLVDPVQAQPVSPRVNRADADDPSLIQPITQLE
ncbi:SOS response-associated peptidase [Caldichromatium japonicum]|uniref:Abasic site processing protein n=1 Tax=Caldichromatium japonicum TaxID=2699430 RepID=A0A6G7VGJ1_9GAMM|nr:SOS response-associated peptidase [Caldichromatium japonicum]QIK38985.1 SOS response-associated peptidase [Caldichromatium japonicum]